MSTVIRADLSTKNKYYIPKHRYYELKHFCLQYPDWIKERSNLRRITRSRSVIKPTGDAQWSDPVAERMDRILELDKMIECVELSATLSDRELARYILKGVTEGKSFTELKTMHDMPCEKDMYYDRYRRFFYILSMSHHLQRV